MLFLIAVRRTTKRDRYAINCRHCRTAASGTCTVGNWPATARSANFWASSRSVLRLTFRHRHASWLTLATSIRRTPQARARSCTHPANAPISITTHRGRCRRNQRPRSSGVVRIVSNAASPVSVSTA